MKTQKSKLVAAFAAFLLVACNNSGGNRSVVPPTPNQGLWANDVSQCVGCFPNAQALLQGVQASVGAGQVGAVGGNLNITMDIFGDPLRGANLSDPNAIQFYNGAVMISGQMIIAQQDWLTCGAAPGQYVLRTITPGMMSGTTINGMLVEAYSTNGVRLSMRWNLMTPYNATGSGLNGATLSNRMGMNVVIDQINGMACGSSFVTY